MHCTVRPRRFAAKLVDGLDTESPGCRKYSSLREVGAARRVEEIPELRPSRTRWHGAHGVWLHQIAVLPRPRPRPPGDEMGVERSSDANDRMMQMLLLALCREQGLQATRKGRKTSKLHVTAPDGATLDRFEARAQELMAKLDQELLALTARFLLEQTGVEFAAPRAK